MNFTGFAQDDFSVFHIPGFEERMPALKARITPKLKQLGEDILPRLRELTGPEIYPHVAQHLRRSVNAPEETWVTFSRSARAYKPFVHFRVSINGEGVKVACFMEEYAEDKPVLAQGLARSAEALGAHLAKHAHIRSHDAEANYGKLRDGRVLDAGDVAKLADRLARVKSQHANWAVKFAESNPIVRSPELVDVAVEAMRDMLPLYRLGTERGYTLACE